MKRLLSITLAVLFVAMAVAAFAAETTFDGQYRIRAWSEWNFDKKAGFAASDYEPLYNGWFDQRFRLTITHTRSEFLKAVVRMDLVEDTWGQQRPFRMNNDGHGLGGPGYVDLAYLEFTLPKLGTFTVGMFPQDFGNGLIYSSGGFWYGSTGIKWEKTWGPVTAAAMYIKYNDRVRRGVTSDFYNRDADMWALDLKVAPNDNHLVELFGGMLLDNRTWFPNGAIEGSYDWQWNGTGSPWSSWTLGFVGLAYTGNIADMIDVRAEYSWIIGKADWDPAHGAGFPDEMSIQGWNAYVDVAYHNDLLRVGVAFLMGSGEKHRWNRASTENINMTYIREDNFWWANVVGNGYGGGASIYYGPGWGGNAENLTSVKLYFEIYPMEKLSLNAAVIWAKWTDPIGSGPAVATHAPAYPHPANWYGNSFYNSAVYSADLGWEIDFGFNYEIMEGLDYSFGAGVLFTGDSFDYLDQNGTRHDWGPIWSISNVLKYSF
jgi:hypothetical protein